MNGSDELTWHKSPILNVDCCGISGIDDRG